MAVNFGSLRVVMPGMQWIRRRGCLSRARFKQRNACDYENESMPVRERKALGVAELDGL